MKVETIEQGTAGHFMYSNRCCFRRSTVVVCGDNKYIVSTVGAMKPLKDVSAPFPKMGYEEIGYHRYFETKIFKAGMCICGCDFYIIIPDEEFTDHDLKWEILTDHISSGSKANIMHDTFVEYMKNYLLKGEKIVKK